MEVNSRAHPLIFCAVDTADQEKALTLASAVALAGCGIKLGLEFFNAQGPQGVRNILRVCDGAPLFLDLKFHDIPNTVAGAVRAITALEPAYINVHAAGGLDMMKAACEAARTEAERMGVRPPKILGVTILTSFDDETLQDIGFALPVAPQVVRLAQLTQQAGLDGVVCSAHEIEAVRKNCGDNFITMVPGIRREAHISGSDDQKRTMTPVQALQAGATHLVMGRSITASNDPGAEAVAILQDTEERLR